MPSGYWDRAKELLHAALEMDAARRPGFLDEACGADTALRRDVESLVVAYDGDPAFIESPLVDTRALALAHDQMAMAGRHIGPYIVVRALGSGGMGTVYLAERADAQYVGRVAVKVIRLPGGAPDRRTEMLRRVRRERQALAGLDHPNIARLIDAGGTPEGDPYLILEYVEGIPITRYCDEHALPIADRIALFLAVCGAVHHAHQNLIVHRDLKPGNILVTDDGVPKLLDFGIAKLIAPEEAGVDATQMPFQALTPAYASPEQIRGEPATTQTDVYALGVLLYELLTGRRPFAVEGRPTIDIMRTICEQEPERPSTAAAGPAGTGEVGPEEHARRRATEPGRLSLLLRDDLDSIVLKALDKEPRRRYASAEALAEDLRRHLSGLPVVARDATIRYRAGKFLRRNRVGVAATCAIMLAGAAGLAGTTWAAIAANRNLRRAREAEAVATMRAIVADRTASFLTDLTRETILFASAPSDGPRLPGDVAAEFVSRGQRRLDEFRDDPAARASVMAALARTEAMLGIFGRARTLAAESLEVRRSLAKGRDSLEVADSLHTLGDVIRREGEQDEAEAILLEALAMRRRLHAGPHPSIAATLNLLGRLRKDRGDYAGAEATFREALDVHRGAVGADDPTSQDIKTNLGYLLLARREFDAAIGILREVLESQIALLGEAHPMVGSAINNVGVAQREKGDYVAAAESSERAIAILRATEESSSLTLSSALENAASCYLELGRLDDAEAALTESLRIRTRLFGDDHKLVAHTLRHRGRLALERGRLDEAEASYTRALEIYGRWPDSTRAHELGARDGLAEVLIAAERCDEAEDVLRETVGIYRAMTHPDPWQFAGTLGLLGQALMRQGRPADAEAHLRESLDRFATPPVKDPEVAHAQSRYGACLSALGRYDEAAPLLENAVPVLERALGPGHGLTVQAMRRLITHLEATGESARAADLRARIGR